MKQNFITESTNKYFYGNASALEGEVNFSFTATFVGQVDLTQIESIRKRMSSGERTTYTAFIAKAIAIALRELPYGNRRFYRPFGFLSRRFQIFKSVDIAIASETQIPNAEYVAFFDILREVENKSLGEVSEWLYKFRTTTEENEQWKTYKMVMTRFPRWLGRLLVRLPVYFPQMWYKYRGGAVMISSPAKYGVDTVLAAWPSPLGFSFGLVKDRVLAKSGKVEICPTFDLIMNFDRRLMAGAPAARIFKRIVEVLENWPNGEKV